MFYLKSFYIPMLHSINASRSLFSKVSIQFETVSCQNIKTIVIQNEIDESLAKTRSKTANIF